MRGLLFIHRKSARTFLPRILLQGRKILCSFFRAGSHNVRRRAYARPRNAPAIMTINPAIIAMVTIAASMFVLIPFPFICFTVYTVYAIVCNTFFHKEVFLRNGDRNIARAMAKVSTLQRRRHQSQGPKTEAIYTGEHMKQNDPNAVEPQQPKNTPPAKKGSFRDDRDDHFGNNAGGHETLERDDD